MLPLISNVILIQSHVIKLHHSLTTSNRPWTSPSHPNTRPWQVARARGRLSSLRQTLVLSVRSLSNLLWLILSFMGLWWVLIADHQVFRIVLRDLPSLLLSCMLKYLVVIDWKPVDSAAVAYTVNLSISLWVIIYSIMMHWNWVGWGLLHNWLLATAFLNVICTNYNTVLNNVIEIWWVVRASRES